MSKITHQQSFFTYLLDKKQMYTKWSKKIYYVHLPQHLAIKTFGFNENHLLPSTPPDRYTYSLLEHDYQKTLVMEIVRKIANEYRERSINET
jgi:hypothetical protein